MQIKVLGTGCKKCATLTNNTKEAVKNLEIDAEVIKVEDIQEILAMAVMSTPALVIDGELKSIGKSLSVADVEKLIKESL